MKMEAQCSKSFADAAKAVLRETFIVIQAYPQKQETFWEW